MLIRSGGGKHEGNELDKHVLHELPNNVGHAVYYYVILVMLALYCVAAGTGFDNNECLLGHLSDVPT